jgi:hypothetical protein
VQVPSQAIVVTGVGWVGFLALSRGFSHIMLAFSIRHPGGEAAAIDPARPR